MLVAVSRAATASRPVSGVARRTFERPPHEPVSLGLSLALAAAVTFHAPPRAVPDKPKDRGTLQSVKDRGSLSCGVSQGLPGFSAPDDKGNWTGSTSTSAAPSLPRCSAIP